MNTPQQMTSSFISKCRLFSLLAVLLATLNQPFYSGGVMVQRGSYCWCFQSSVTLPTHISLCLFPGNSILPWALITTPCCWRPQSSLCPRFQTLSSLKAAHLHLEVTQSQQLTRCHLCPADCVLISGNGSHLVAEARNLCVIHEFSFLPHFLASRYCGSSILMSHKSCHPSCLYIF